MTIAAQVKSFHVELDQNNGSESVKNWDDFTAECEEKAIETDQDWDAESTTYTFADGSCIVSSSGHVSAYGSK